MQLNRHTIRGLTAPVLGAALLAGAVLAGGESRVVRAADDCPPGAAAQAQITTEQATEVALGQTAGTLHEIKLECEDGRLIYDVEIQPTAGGRHVEVEIDAVTGAVLKIERD